MKHLLAAMKRAKYICPRCGRRFGPLMLERQRFAPYLKLCVPCEEAR